MYLAETPAASLLEVCVHTSAADAPPAFTLLKIKGPDLEVPSITIDRLPKGWQTQLEVTRDLGTAWLKRNESVLLRVPSRDCARDGPNFLFNPSAVKQAAKFRIAGVFSLSIRPSAQDVGGPLLSSRFGDRLKKLRSPRC